jgi:hypothetical protein
MGFLDKLLGRGKKAVDTAEDKLHMHDHDHGEAAAEPPPAAPAPAAPEAGAGTQADEGGTA